MRPNDIARRRVKSLALLAGAVCLALGTGGFARRQASAPDLIVRQDVLAHQWVVRDEDLPGTLCSVEEGNITPGTHTIVRFTVMTPNVGNADIALGDPNAHIPFAGNYWGTTVEH